MLKKLSIFFISVIILFNLSSCNKSSSNSDKNSKLKVSVTFNAIKEFVYAVGKDKVDISTIIPDNIEPHDFEPKAKDIANLSSADIFVYNGFGMESWVDNAIQAANNTKLISVEASKGIDPIINTDSEEIKTHGQYDPHTWLSLKSAVIAVKNIKDALVKSDPDNKNFYENNYSNFINQLENLHSEYDQKFQLLKDKNIVTGHAAFAYLCRDFDLIQNSVESTFAEGLPTAKQLSDLVQYCKDNNITTIFAEEMASPDVSKTLANELGAKVVTIYTLEGSENNMTYLSRLESNLSKIYESLNK